MSSQTVAIRERMEATQAAPAERGATVADLLRAQQPAFARALPRTMAPERFARVVLTECKKNPRLLGADPMTLLGAVMSAAQLGLEPGPLGHAYLVPRKNKARGIDEVTLILGYQGLIDLALRSGRVESIHAEVVRDADEFDFAYGTGAFLRHRPSLETAGAVVAVYAVAQLPGGGSTFRVLGMDEVARRRGRSSAPEDKGPWSTDFDAMARKSAVRALAPYLPKSIEFAQAVRLDETVRRDISAPIEELDPADDPDVSEGSTATPAHTDPGEGDPASDSVAPPPSDDVNGGSKVSAEGSSLSPSELIARAKSMAEQVSDEELEKFCVDTGIPVDRRKWNATHAERLVEWLEAS